MRRTDALLLILLLVIAPLAGCSGGSNGPASPTITDTVTDTTAPTSPTAAPSSPHSTATVVPPTETATSPSTATPTPSQTATQSAALPSPIDGGTARQATVIEVTDGDTVDVRFATGETATVRLLGVDTPEPIMSNMDPNEYGIPDTPHGRGWLLNWSNKASSFATTELAGEQVLVVTDPASDNRGYYGRLLVYIYYDDSTNFGKQLLQRGYARVYTGGEFVLEDEYLDLEASAQTADEGLWAFEDEQPSPTPTPEQPPETTASPGDLPPPSNDGDLPDPYDCSDFDGYPDDVLRTYMQNHPDDPSELDADGDGVACGVGYR
jgi:micrococcal nuclease